MSAAEGDFAERAVEAMAQALFAVALPGLPKARLEDEDVEVRDHYYDSARAALSALAPLLAAERERAWRPIETAPDGEEVLLACAERGYVARGWRDHHAHHGWVIVGGLWSPSHWMPLPPPPAQERGE